MKKRLILILAVIAAVLLAGVFVVFLSLNSIVKKGFEAVGPKLTQVEMRLAGVNLSPLSGSGQLKGLFIGNPQGFKTESAIQVGEVKVAMKPMSLLSDTIVVEDVTVQAPEITFEWSLSGSNLGKILANLEEAVGGKDESAHRANRKRSSRSSASTSKAARSNSASQDSAATRCPCPCPPSRSTTSARRTKGSPPLSSPPPS